MVSRCEFIANRCDGTNQHIKTGECLKTLRSDVNASTYIVNASACIVNASACIVEEKKCDRAEQSQSCDRLTSKNAYTSI
ncbi:MAG: hypothetical protein HC862_11465 [Scytonema sp. RU_4_4]|nr:hypothetical protein [Scytonema sp. RU_4_4]